MRSAALVVLGPVPTLSRTTDTQSLRIWAMWLHETRKLGEMDMAMLTVEGMPPSSASSFWIARVSAGWVTQQRRYPEVADFVYLHGSPFPDDSLAPAR